MAIVSGILINILTTVGGMMKMWISFEKRLTIMETRIEYYLPKRKDDRNISSNC